MQRRPTMLPPPLGLEDMWNYVGDLGELDSTSDLKEDLGIESAPQSESAVRRDFDAFFATWWRDIEKAFEKKAEGSEYETEYRQDFAATRDRVRDQLWFDTWKIVQGQESIPGRNDFISAAEKYTWVGTLPGYAFNWKMEGPLDRLYHMLYDTFDPDLGTEDGWARAQYQLAAGVPSNEAYYEETARWGRDIIAALAAHYNVPEDKILTERPDGTIQYFSTECQVFADTFMTLLSNTRTEDFEGGNYKAVIDDLVSLSEDTSTGWIIDAFLGTDDRPGVWRPTGVMADHKVAFLKDFEYEQTLAGEVEASELKKEKDRLEWAKVYLNRDLTTAEEIYIKANDRLDIPTAATLPQLTGFYNFYETGGVASPADEARQAWRRFVANTDIPMAVRAEFDNFNVLYHEYEDFSTMAFRRADLSELYAVTGVYLSDDIVPYTIWSFGDWLKAQAAMTSFYLEAIWDEPGGGWGALAGILQEHDLNPAYGPILLRRPGESYADLYDRIMDTFKTDPEWMDMMIGIGAIPPAPSTILESVIPDILMQVRARVIRPEVDRERIEELLLALEYGEPDADFSIEGLWNVYTQRHPTPDALGDASDMSATIIEYQDAFATFVLDIIQPLLEPTMEELTEAVEPRVVAGVTRRFLPEVAPERRAAFIEQLQLALPTLWTRYGEVYGPPPTGPEAPLESYMGGFVDWMRTQDFFKPGLIGEFPSLQKQLAKKPKVYTPTIRQRMRRFGLGR